jgi:uncharacterized membrane protein YphA (DoxX/SURF4 family)
MNDSMAQARAELAPLDLPGWKSVSSWVAAALLAVLFLVSGVWKITYPQDWAVRISEFKFPESLSLPAALACGIAETVGAVLIFVPRFRRWGSILLSVLLAVFIGYFALNYSALRGAECSCFPLVKRVVGPFFFVSDGALLGLAILAGAWAAPPRSLRSAVLVLGAVTVYALVSFGVTEALQSGTKAPETVTVSGAPYSLQHGRIFLFFFDPECMHCFNSAKKMSKLDWGETKVVAIPVSQPRYAQGFLQETGLKAVVSSDFDKLKHVFPYTAVPAGVALENGREKAAVTKFEEDSEPAATLRELGFVK